MIAARDHHQGLRLGERRDELADLRSIREDVAFWNKHRKVKINCISIGGNLEILEWIATDAGGKYVEMR